MKNVFLRLALTGIKKNRRMFLPYIISCAGCVAVYFIIHYLSVSPYVREMHGGSNMSLLLSMGKFIIVAFSLIFLFYTNSFLVRRRNMEFGLYNVLGMDKKGIFRIIIAENSCIAAVSTVSGMLAGAVLSKLAELCLKYLCREQADFSFAVYPEPFLWTAGLFLAVFAVLTVRSAIEVRRSDALTLLQRETKGEKPPKGNLFIALSGAVILSAAYVLALTIKSPLSAIFVFLIAVLMVIIATYILFISGSVCLCGMLKKNKKYYYKKNHFVSVSTMAYRMKRNGAGLASICILSTMVLVMVASSASLYFGANDSINARFPRDNQLDVILPGLDKVSDDKIRPIRDDYERVFSKNGVKPENVTDYFYASVTGLSSEHGAQADVNGVINQLFTYSDLRYIIFMPQDAYNRLTGRELSVEKGQAALYTLRCGYDSPVFEMNGVKLAVTQRLTEYPACQDALISITPGLMFVIHDLGEIAPLDTLNDYNGDKMLTIRWHYGYDLPRDEETTKRIFSEMRSVLEARAKKADESASFIYYTDCRAEEYEDFYVTYGSLLFIGGMFSVIFILAMAMIIYYKQFSEGFEDMKRFSIMRKVGMTERDIKKSVNSQTLTVFFAPLIFAGIHFCFAFPPIWKLLQLFNLHNLPLVIGVSASAFAVFGLIYMAIYKATSKAYCKLVSAG